MKKIALYVAAIVCGCLGVLGTLRMVESLAFGGSSNASAYGVGQLIGQGLFAVLFLLLSWKAYSTARAADGAGT